MDNVKDDLVSFLGSRNHYNKNVQSFQQKHYPKHDIEMQNT